MLKPAGHGASISLNQLPVLDGALDCFAQGISSSLQPQNSQSQYAINNYEQWIEHPVYPLLFDAQTSGGLLASVAESEVESCLQSLHKTGYKKACVVGHVLVNTAVKKGGESVLLQE
jgi:selenide,water dikinase